MSWMIACVSSWIIVWLHYFMIDKNLALLNAGLKFKDNLRKNDNERFDDVQYEQKQ